MENFTCIIIGLEESVKLTCSYRLIKDLNTSHTNPVRKFEAEQELKKMSEEHTTIGNTARRIIGNGKTPSDEVVNLAIDSFLKNLNDSDSCIFDNYPRTLKQAIFFDSALHKNRRKDPVFVVHMRSKLELELKKILEKSEDEYLYADNPEYVKSNLACYKEQVVPVIKFYKEAKNYVFIEADQHATVDEAYDVLLNQIFTYYLL